MMNVKPNYPWQIPGQEQENLRAFAFFSANLNRMLPQIPLRQHADFFQQCLSYKALATDDDRNISILHADILNKGAQLALDKPGIIATFHTGPYRLLPLYLMKQKIPFTLLVSRDVAQQQGAANCLLQQRLAGKGKEMLFDTLIVEEPLVLLKLKRAIEAGRFVLAYIDGNMGAARSGRSKRDVLLSFLGDKLWVKTGVADMAFRLACPFYISVANFDEQGKAWITLYQVLGYAAHKSRAAFIVNTMQKLYNQLEATIREYPMQWEGWLYIHADLERVIDTEQTAYVRHYMPFEIDGNYFLLHKHSYAAFRIPKEIFDKIKEIYFDKGWFSLN